DPICGQACMEEIWDQMLSSGTLPSQEGGGGNSGSGGWGGRSQAGNGSRGGSGEEGPPMEEIVVIGTVPDPQDSSFLGQPSTEQGSSSTAETRMCGSGPVTCR